MAYRHERELATRFPRYFSRTRDGTGAPAKRLFRSRLLETFPAIGGAILGIALMGATAVIPAPRQAPAAVKSDKAEKFVHVPPHCVRDFTVRKGSSQEEMDSKAKKECETYAKVVEQDHPAVRKVVKDALKTRGAFCIEQAFEIYDHIAALLQYQNVSQRLNPFPASQTLSEGSGDCKNLTVALASALLSVGAPVRVIIDKGNGDGEGHVFLELRLPKDVSAKKVADAINVRYRVQDRIAFIEDSKKMGESLVDVQNKIAEKTVPGIRSLIEEAKAAAGRGEDFRPYMARINKAQATLNRLGSLLGRAFGLLKQQRSLAVEIAKGLGDDYLWVNGKPVVYKGIKINKAYGANWLVLDLTTGSYPGYFPGLRKYRADIVLILMPPA